MRKIIASLDIGSSSIKLVVGEIQHGKLKVLSCIDVVSQGIKKGYIVNPESAMLALNDVFSRTEKLIGIPIKKVIVNVPAYNLECFVSKGSSTITSEDKVINHNDLTRAMQASVYNQVEDNKEIITVLPTKFILNDEAVVTNPINAIANKLTVNDVIAVLPKKNIEMIIKCLEKMGIEVFSTCVSPLADYYQFKNEEYASEVGAIINLGQTNMTLSVFNKGILTACEVVDIGANAVDNDISYVFKINKKDANYLKEKLVVADLNEAQPNENMVVRDVNDQDIKINQYDISAVAIPRLTEMLNLAKKRINLLTKKKISYIIVSGGISELKCFNILLENLFGRTAVVGNVDDIGSRHNKYSVALGMIKYYNSRLKLRNAEFSIFSLEEQDEFGGCHKRINISDNSLLGKIYRYFFDN